MKLNPEVIGSNKTNFNNVGSYEYDNKFKSSICRHR